MESNAKILSVSDLQKNDYTHFPDLYRAEMFELYNSIENGATISVSDIDLITRLTLRENIWCKLVSESMFVHFGYDLYMYIGCRYFPNNELTIFQEKGLFFEEMNSPYVD